MTMTWHITDDHLAQQPVTRATAHHTIPDAVPPHLCPACNPWWLAVVTSLAVAGAGGWDRESSSRLPQACLEVAS